jgi:hypothetical protein
LVADNLFPFVGNWSVTADIGSRPVKREGHKRTLICGFNRECCQVKTLAHSKKTHLKLKWIDII